MIKGLISKKKKKHISKHEIIIKEENNSLAMVKTQRRLCFFSPFFLHPVHTKVANNNPIIQKLNEQVGFHSNNREKKFPHRFLIMGRQ